MSIQTEVLNESEATEVENVEAPPQSDELDEFGVDSEGRKRTPGRHKRALCTCSDCKSFRAGEQIFKSLDGETSDKPSEKPSGGKAAASPRAKKAVSARMAMKPADRAHMDYAILVPSLAGAANITRGMRGRVMPDFAHVDAAAQATALVTSKYNIPMEGAASLMLVGSLLFGGEKVNDPKVAEARALELQAKLDAHMADLAREFGFKK